MKNSNQDLINHLFEQIENLKDAKGEDLAKEIEKSEAMAGLASVIIGAQKNQIQAVTLMLKHEANHEEKEQLKLIINNKSS